MEIISLIAIASVIVGSGIGGLFIYKKSSAKLLPYQQEVSQQSEDTNGFSDFKVGNILKLLNYGANIEDYDLQITRKDVFTESGNEWFQYEAKGDTCNFFFHTMPQDNWEPYILTEKTTIDIIPLTENEIRNFRAIVKGSFTYKQIVYTYKMAGSAFLRFQDSGPQKIDYWYFYSDDKNNFLKIERLDPRNPMTVTIFEKLPRHKYEYL